MALHSSEDVIPARSKDGRKFAKYVRLALGHHCKIEDIASGEFCPAMPNLLGDDLSAVFGQPDVL